MSPDAMSPDAMSSLLAAIAVLPAAVISVRSDQRGRLFLVLVGLAFAGPAIWLAMRSGSTWQTDLASALWITVVASMLCFAALCIVSSAGARLSGVVLPYMAILSFMAFAWEFAGDTNDTAIRSTWIIVHILVSVLTYAVVTLAACAACAGFLQERALKTKSTTDYTRRLPSVSDCNDLQFKLLALGEMVLGAGLLSGVASSLATGGPVFTPDHKTLFAVSAFIIIGVLLIAQPKAGIRGKQVMRVILSAYLLLTLAYPGVKFVTHVVLGN